MTPLAADRQGQTLEQIRRLYADDASVLDEVERTWTLGSTDYMRQPLEAFLAEAGVERVQQIPLGVSSVRRAAGRAGRAARASSSRSTGRRTSAASARRYWRFYPRHEDGSYGGAMADEVEIFRAIACRRAEPRAPLPWPSAGPTVIDWDLLAAGGG